MFPNLNLANDAYIHIIEAGQDINFVEKQTAGKGVARFVSTSSSLMIKAHDNPPLIWALNNRKCAEGAFLTYSIEKHSYTLHIVEMKSKLTASEFCKVLSQFEGMYLAALSILGAMKIDAPGDVRLYVAYKTDAFTESQPAFLKTLVGGELPKGLKEWITSATTLPHQVSATIVKGVRIGADCDFGAV